MTKINTRLGNHCRPMIQGAQGARWAAATAALVSLTMGSYVSTAHAQAAAAPAAGAAENLLTEVVVTARRREESAQTVPIAITALGGEELTDKRIVSLENIQSAVPEFSMSQASGRPNAPVYGLRGIRPTEAIYGQDPTVAIYFADVVLSPASNTNLGLYDLASVQVLKGPQGTLFGRNTTGGAVLMTPKRPGKEFGGEAMVGAGNYGKYEAQLAIDLPVFDSLAMRLSGRYIDSEGYQTNVVNGSKLGGEGTKNVRLSILWDITDSIENYTIGTYDEKNTNGRGLVLKAANPRNATALDPDYFNQPIGAAGTRCYDGPTNPNGACPGEVNLGDYFASLARAQNRSINDVESDMSQYDKIDVWGVINTTTIKLGDSLTLKGIGGYHDFKTKNSIDLDASSIVGLLDATGNEELTSASYEIQLLGEAFDKRLNWVTGLYWYYEDGFQNSPGRVQVGNGASSFDPFSQRGDVHNNTYSAFAQGSYNLTPDLSLTAGVRYTQDEKEMIISTHTPTACAIRDVNNNPILVGSPPDFSKCHVDLKDSFSKPTGTLSLDYKLTSDVLLYATSRYGYRAGGFNLRGTAPITYVPFQPETVLDIEIGTKADWEIGSVQMRSNFAIYNQWYDDIQRTVGVSNPSGVPGSAVQNAAKAEVFGVELQQTIAPTRNLSFQINYAYTHPKYKNWTEVGSDAIDPTLPAAQRTFPIVDLSSTPFHFTPKHAATGSATFTLPLANPGEELMFAASASYRSHVYINALQTSAAIARIEKFEPQVLPFIQQSGYTTFDLNAGWKSMLGIPLDLSAYVKNVADKEYVVGGIQLYESAYHSVSRIGITANAYGEPRTFGAELRYHF